MNKEIIDGEKKYTRKKLIIDTAQRMYYRDGFDETSFDAIAKECNITKPLITYHFGTKTQLGGKIFGKYSKEQANIFFEKAFALDTEANYIYIYFAYSLMCVKYYLADKNAFRFYTQYFSQSFTDITPGIEDFYKSAGKLLKTNDKNNILHMQYIGAQYAARGLIYHYVNGEIQCSWEDFAYYYLSFFNIHRSENKAALDNAIKESFKVLDAVNITLKPDFVWE